MTEKKAVTIWFLIFSATLIIDARLSVIFLIGTLIWIIYK